MIPAQMNTLILLVDDDPVVNFLHRKMLQKRFPHTEIEVFENPERALEFLNTGSQCSGYCHILLLLDINMPEIDGWQFLEEAREMKCHSKLVVFMLTSSVAEEDMEHCRNYEAVKGYITKPLNLEKMDEICEHPAVEAILM